MSKLDHLKHLALTAFLSLAPVLIVMLTGSKWGHAAWVAPFVALVRWAVAAAGGTTTTIVLVGLGLATYGAQGCAHTSPPVTTFVNCTTEAGKQAAEGILGDVMTALATSNYIAALASLVTQFGIAEVKCAVELAVASLSTQHAAAPAESEVGLMLARGNMWLASQP